MIQPGDICTFTRRSMNPPGVYLVKCTEAQKAKALAALRRKEQRQRATGQEVSQIMLANDHPDWSLFVRHQRIRQLDGTVKHRKTYTLVSPEGERRLRARKERPSPLRPMEHKKGGSA